MKFYPLNTGLILLLIAVVNCSGLQAQSIFDDATKTKPESENTSRKSAEIHGYGRTVTYLNPEKASWGNTFAETELRLLARHESALIRADLRLRRSVSDDEESWQAEPRELYAGISTEHFDLFAGYQIVSWGRTDGFNPTANISAKNYFFLSDNPDDQWMSNLMLRAKIRPYRGAVELEIIGIPVYQSSVYQYELFDLGDNVLFANPVLPERIPENGTLAAKLNFEWPALGASVSWFRGYDPYHGFGVQQIDWSGGSPLITNAAISYLKTSWGADLAIPIGNTIFRAEAARNITENPNQWMHIPMSDWSYVGAIEKSAGGLTVIAQYIGKYIPDFSELTVPVLSDPLNPMAQVQYANEMIMYENSLFNRRIFHQQKKSNHAVSVTFSGRFAYDTWRPELTAYYNISSGDWLMRGLLRISINDALEVTTGASYMGGKDKSLFSYSADIMNGIFAALKVSF